MAGTVCMEPSGCKYRSDIRIIVLREVYWEFTRIWSRCMPRRTQQYTLYTLHNHMNLFGKHIVIFLFYISISRLLFCRRIVNLYELDVSVCVCVCVRIPLCRVAFDKLCSFVYRLCFFHYYGPQPHLRNSRHYSWHSFYCHQTLLSLFLWEFVYV